MSSEGGWAAGKGRPYLQSAPALGSYPAGPTEGVSPVVGGPQKELRFAVDDPHPNPLPASLGEGKDSLGEGKDSLGEKDLIAHRSAAPRFAVARAAEVLHPLAVSTAGPDLVDSLVRALVPRPEILEAYLFGSQARGTARLDSDVDVAVYVDPTCDMNQGFGLDSAITADLMAALGRNNVDVVILNRADPVLYHRVLRDGIRLLVRNAKATAGREGYALSRYFDFLPQIEKIRGATERRAQQGRFGR